jgi:hypothetical protein
MSFNAKMEKGEIMAPQSENYIESMSRGLFCKSCWQMLPISIHGAAPGFLALSPLSSGFLLMLERLS